MAKIIIGGDFRAKETSDLCFSEELKGLLKSADLRVCNFEAPVEVQNPKALKAGPSIDQKAETAQFLIENGFDVILLANNHVMDFGEAGLFRTKDAFKTVTTVGAGDAKEAYSLKVVRVCEKRIGFLSLVQYEFGVLSSVDSEGHGAAWVNSLDIRDIIEEGKKTVDCLIVCPHAGIECVDAPLPEWRKVYRSFIKWGADAVVASHPHTPQGWEVYKGRYIFYSLGNFFFDGLEYGNHWHESLLVELEIDDKVSANVYNLRFSGNTISMDHSEEIKKHTNYLLNLLENEDAYKEYIDKLCDDLYYPCCYRYLRGFGGVTTRLGLKHFIRLLGVMFLRKQDELLLLNAIRCESHRWLVERYIRNHYNVN